MDEEKPRHERILERMNALTDEYVKKITLRDEGSFTVIQQGSNFNISSDKQHGKTVEIEPIYDANHTPLYKKGDGFALNIGSIDSMVPSLGGVCIYGDGTAGSVPVLPTTDAEVWAQCTILPIQVYNDGFGSFFVGHMSATVNNIITTAIGVIPAETLATCTIATGAVTAGTYYYWIGQILNQAANTTTPLSSRQYRIAFGGNYFGITVGNGNVGLDPNITYI